MRYEHPYYTDFIDFSHNPFIPKSEKNLHLVADLCLSKNLSASQISDKLGISKTSVLEKLHSLDIRFETGKGRMTNPENYRAPNAPFGYKIIDGRLMPYKKEIKICRLVVTLKNEEKISFNAIAKSLTEKKIKNRSGSYYWDHKVTKSIYERWNEKL